MFFIDCLGSLENDNKTNLNFSKQEFIYWNSKEECIGENERLNTYKSVCLFNNEYHQSLAIRLHLDELFSLGRKYFQFLSKAARNAIMPASIVLSEYQDFGYLRRNIVELFVFIRNALKDIRYLIENREIEKAKTLVAHINQNIYSFRLMLKAVDCLPDFVIRNSTSEVGNQCLLASFHLFHIHLELHWLHLTIMIEIHILENLINEETFPDTEDFNILSNNFSSEDIPCNQYSRDIEGEIEWILYNLVLLASRCYDKIGSKQIFSCSCVKQIWLSTQMVVENLHSQNKCADFWHYYNRIFKLYVLQIDNKSDVTKTKNCITLFKMNKIACANKWEFSIWLLLNVVQLQGFNSDGCFVGITSQRITPNYSLLEDILKQFMNNESNVNESSLRDQMRHIVKLMTVWWEPKNDIITLLWEYFHKRLNSAFSVAGRDDSNVSFSSMSAPNIIDDLKSRFSLDHSTKRDHRLESSFSLFITLLGAHLKKSVDTNQHSNCQRIKGRILPKFTQNKIMTLNELGLQHFATIFLIMGISTDFQDMCSKLQNLINQISYDTLPWPKKQVILKTYICVLYLYVDNGANIDTVSKPLLSIATKCCLVRDTESMALMKLIVNGVQDILDASQSFECGEFTLIDLWLSKYLQVCPLSDLTNSLEFISSLLGKLSILSSYHGFSSENSIGMVDRLFQHVLPCLKNLYANGTVSLQISSTSFTFTKFIFENGGVLKKYESFADILKYFLLCDNSNEKVMRHYLTETLQDERICESFVLENKQCVGYLIHSWIRCSLLSSDNSDDDTHLALLLRQLPDFSSLNITPSCNSGDQRNLCNFFLAIGKKWNQTESFQEKCQLRERVNEYLISMDKYVVSALKSPSSMEYVMQIFLVLGTLFINCSPIIYSRAKPTCLLHSIISNILLPPQLFMEKKVHPYVLSGICKSWYMFMRGLYVLDYKNDVYIEKAMKDMILQYLPHFVNKTLPTKINTFDVSYRMIPNDPTSDLVLEKYILEKISVNFVTCRGKQSNIHAPKALAVIYHLIFSTTSSQLISTIITCTLVSVCEQFMFSEVGSVNKKIAGQILEQACKNQFFNQADGFIRNDVLEMLAAACRKHLAFNSGPFFKLLVQNVQGFLPIMDDILANLESEISKVERMRGVGFDHGLRNSLKEVVTSYSKLKTQS